MSKELKMLMNKGGRGRRRHAACKQWEYFPKKVNKLTRKETILNKKSILQGLDECADNQQEYEKETKIKASSHQVLNTSALETLINDNLVCHCSVTTKIDDFLDFSISHDSQIYYH